MAPLAHVDKLDKIGEASDKNVAVLVGVSTAIMALLFVLFSVLVAQLCACGGDKKEAEGEKKEDVVPPPSSQLGGNQVKVSSKGPEPVPACSKSSPAPPAAGKSAKSEPHKTKITLTPPGATCPPVYIPDDEDKTVNVEGLLKKG